VTWLWQLAIGAVLGGLTAKVVLRLCPLEKPETGPPPDAPRGCSTGSAGGAGDLQPEETASMKRRPAPDPTPAREAYERLCRKIWFRLVRVRTGGVLDGDELMLGPGLIPMIRATAVGLRPGTYSVRCRVGPTGPRLPDFGTLVVRPSRGPLDPPRWVLRTRCGQMATPDRRGEVFFFRLSTFAEEVICAN
jgi:hypothetical protein